MIDSSSNIQEIQIQTATNKRKFSCLKNNDNNDNNSSNKKQNLLALEFITETNLLQTVLNNKRKYNQTQLDKCSKKFHFDSSNLNLQSTKIQNIQRIRHELEVVHQATLDKIYVFINNINLNKNKVDTVKTISCNLEKIEKQLYSIIMPQSLQDFVQSNYARVSIKSFHILQQIASIKEWLLKYRLKVK